MLLDRLLAELDVDVEPFALCLVGHGWRLRLPGPPEAMLHFVLEGEGTLLDLQERRHAIGPGWLAIIPRGAAHALESDRVEHELRVETSPPCGLVPRVVAGSERRPALSVACGIVRVRYGDTLGLFDQLRDALLVDLSDSPAARTVFAGILAEQAHPGPGASALARALMSQCLVLALRQLCASPSCTLPWLSALEDPRLARALDRIIEDPSAGHTVESLADAAGMSRSAFAEHFTAAFHQTPMGMVHHVRMQRAAHLLRRGEPLSVDQVADRVGFSSRSHFSRAFKKHVGLSPADYRAAPQDEAAPTAAAARAPSRRAKDPRRHESVRRP